MQNKNKQLTINFSEEDKQKLIQASKKIGLCPATFVRYATILESTKLLKEEQNC